MYQKLSFTSVLAAIIQKVEQNTGLRCYDGIPKDAEMPYYHVQMVGTIPEPSKTMQKDRYQVVILVFADAPNGSSVPIFEAIQKLEEALTEDIELPGDFYFITPVFGIDDDDYEVTLQIPNGLSQILDEEDGTKHAVLGYDFVVFSGYKVKI